MIQFIVLGLFIMALIAGIYTHFEPSSPKPLNPLGFMMDKSGYTEMQTQNLKKTQEVNITTSAGIMQVRKQMDDLALVQNNFLEAIQDQQQMLKGAGKDARDVLQLAKSQGGLKDKDILQLEALTSQIDDDQRLSVAHGQQLVSLNDRITQNRQWISEQIDYANIYTDATLRAIQDHNRMLKSQEAEFYNNMYGYRQEMRDSLARMRERLQVLANCAYEDKVLEKIIKGHARHMLAKERENLIRLADEEERNKDKMRDLQQNLEDAQERLNETQQQAKDTMEDERQKQQDQQTMMNQRIADERARMQDQQNR